MCKNILKKLQSIVCPESRRKSKGCFLKIFFRFKQHIVKICDHSQLYTGCPNFFRSNVVSIFKRPREGKNCHINIYVIESIIKELTKKKDMRNKRQ